jgi:O-methyltransferase
MIKNLMKTGFAKIGIQVHRTNRISSRRPNPIHKWDDDVIFQNIMKLVEGHTLVDIVRCYMLYQFSLQTSELYGEVAEIGVYKGGTAMLLAKTFERSGKKIHLFDTFSGMPDTNREKDLHKQGDFSDTSLAAVNAYLCKCSNLHFHSGYFPDTASWIGNQAFAMVHVDVDIYQSVMDCMKIFYPRLVAGGVMVIDDYGFVTCPGAKQAVDEFFIDRHERPYYLPTGQCVVIKLPSVNR